MCHIVRLILRIVLAQSSGKHVSKETRRSWKTVLHVWTVWTVISCKFCCKSMGVHAFDTYPRSFNVWSCFSWEFGNHLDHVCSNVLQVSLGIDVRYGFSGLNTKSVFCFWDLGRLNDAPDMSVHTIEFMGSAQKGKPPEKVTVTG